MKPLIVLTAVFTITSQAQDTVRTFVYSSSSSVMGKVIKGAPYTADEITESLQVLADGTRISRQSQVTVYRDGEGRVRRDSPTQITIFDPVAGASYALDPKTMTATKTSLGTIGSSGPVQFAFSPKVSSDTEVGAVQGQMKVMLDKLQAETAARDGAMTVNGVPAGPQASYSVNMQLDQIKAKLAAEGRNPAVAENLGRQVIEGVTAEGSRSTTTIEAGAIGNDRPIHVVSERWTSPELQTLVLTRRSDPRSGDETFRLANIRLGEPGADLFLLPPGYQLVATPTPKEVKVRKDE